MRLWHEGWGKVINGFQRFVFAFAHALTGITKRHDLEMSTSVSSEDWKLRVCHLQEVAVHLASR
jgi:hypothetical protein